MRSLPLPLPFRLLAAAFALAAFFALPGRAEATCGSYVVILGQETHSHPGAPAPAPKCHGPNCSRVPAPTPLPIGVTEVVPPELKQQSPLAGLPGDGRDSAFGHPTSCGKPILSQTAVYHPPR
jgi:hypothetical protein